MAIKYADRAFVSVNGTPITDLQSASLKRNLNARPVPTMSRNGRNQGFVQGNLDIDISLSIAIRNATPRPKLESIDYEANDVQITFECGSEIFIATGIFLKDNEDNAGGIGDEVKGTFNFGALDVTDAAGNPASFNIQLG